MPIGKCGDIGRRLDAEGVAGGQPALLASTWRRGSDSRSRRRPRRCAAPSCGTSRRPSAVRARRRAGRRRRGSAGRCADTRPAENSTTSVTIRLPDSSSSTARGVGLDSTAMRGHRLAQPERDVATAHLVEQLVHDLAVEELQRPLAALDQRHRRRRARRTSTRTRCRSRPAPTTASVRGSFFSAVTSSLVRTTSPSAGTPGGRGRARADGDDDAGRADRRAVRVADDLQACADRRTRPRPRAG